MGKILAYEIGIDEVGRGPLAGPVAVCAACVPANFNWKELPGVTDSKKLNKEDRERIFKNAQKLQKEGKLYYTVCMVNARQIDASGIVKAVNSAMAKALRTLHLQNAHIAGECMIKLDGGLRAPYAYENQKTIIRGDQKEKVIGLASIMAKVMRDRHMIRLSKQNPYKAFGFEIHKGYGTKAHRELIRKLGLSTVHRVSFCGNCLKDRKIV